MGRVYVLLEDASGAINQAMDATRCAEESATQVGWHAGRGIVAAIEQAQWYLEAARAAAVAEYGGASGARPEVYDRVYRERYGTARGWVPMGFPNAAEGQMDVLSCPPPPGTLGTGLARAAHEGRL